MKIILIPLVLAAILLSSNNSHPDNIKKNKITISKWHILHNQNSSIEMIKNYKNWKPITIPGFIKHNYIPKRDYQYLWLKAEFDITGDPAQFYGISIGRVYYTDIVYINDEIIGQTSSKDKMSTHYPRNYIINPGVLKRGKNVIYFYLGIYGKQSGGILNQVSILNRNQFKQKKESRLFTYHDYPMGLTVLFLLLFIFLIIFYCFNRSEMSILFSAIFCFMYTITLILDFANNKPISNDLRLTILYYLSALNPLNWFLIVQAFFKRYLPDLNRAIIFYAIIITFLIFSNMDTTSDIYLAKAINRITIITSIFVSPYILFKVYSKNRDRMKMFLFVFYFSFIFIFYLIFFFLSLDGKYVYTVQDIFYIPFLMIHIITLIIKDIIKKESEIKKIIEIQKVNNSEI